LPPPQQQQPPAPPPAPAPAPWPARPAPETYSSSIISLGLGFFVDVGSLPDVAPGMQVAMGLMIPDEYRGEAVVNMFFDDEGDDGYDLFSGGIRGCRLLLPWRYRAFRRGPGFSLWACGGFELGALSFRRRVPDPAGGPGTVSSERDLWGAARGELEGRYQIARSIAAVLVQAGFAVPLGRPVLVGPPEAPVNHSPFPIVGRFGAAFALGY
jgi:hypothetical protein